MEPWQHLLHGQCFASPFQHTSFRIASLKTNPPHPSTLSVFFFVFVELFLCLARFRRGRHEDASEFFLKLLIHIGKGGGTAERLEKIRIEDKGSKDRIDKKIRAMRLADSSVRNLFATYTISTTTCLTCKVSNVNIEAHAPLPLEIPESSGTDATLESILTDYKQVEVLQGANAYKCTSTKSCGPKKQKANKEIVLWDLPEILGFSFNRFKLDFRANRTTKIQTPIKFPLEDFDMSGYLQPSTQGNRNQALLYDLYAVVNHAGSLERGHYWAFVKNINDKQWYEYNDAWVTPIDKNQMQTAHAYLLFYKKKEKRRIDA